MCNVTWVSVSKTSKCLSDTSSLTPFAFSAAYQRWAGLSSTWRLRPEAQTAHFLCSALGSHFNLMGRQQALSEHSNRERKRSPASLRRVPSGLPFFSERIWHFLSNDCHRLPSTFLSAPSFHLHDNSVRWVLLSLFCYVCIRRDGPAVSQPGSVDNRTGIHVFWIPRSFFHTLTPRSTSCFPVDYLELKLILWGWGWRWDESNRAGPFC